MQFQAEKVKLPLSAKECLRSEGGGGQCVEAVPIGGDVPSPVPPAGCSILTAWVCQSSACTGLVAL